MHMNSNDVLGSVLQEEGIVVTADITVIDTEAEVEVTAEIDVVGEIVHRIVEVVIVQVLAVIAKIAEGMQNQRLLQMMILRWVLFFVLIG